MASSYPGVGGGDADWKGLWGGLAGIICWERSRRSRADLFFERIAFAGIVDKERAKKAVDPLLILAVTESPCNVGSLAGRPKCFCAA